MELTQNAKRIAKVFLERSKTGRKGDPEIEVDELCGATGLSLEELQMAINKLESMQLVSPRRAFGRPPGYRLVEPTALLFIELDPLFTDWNPRDDAFRIADELMRSEKGSLFSDELAERLQWAPRRLNPALAHLLRERAVDKPNTLNPIFAAHEVRTNDRTA